MIQQQGGEPAVQGTAGKAADPAARQKMALAFCLLTFLFALRLAVSAFDGGMIDPDYYWHLETGEWIAANGALPYQDIFSYSVAGRDWVLHEWMFQLLLYWTYSLGGEGLVLLATAALGGLSLCVILRLADREIGNSLISLCLLLGFLSVFLIYVTPRPHLFSYLFFALLLRSLWLARYDGRLRALFFAPLVMPFWVNLHGGYSIGLAFLGAFAALEACRYLFAEPGQRPEKRYLVSLSLSFAATIGASCLNPDGPAHLIYPLYVMGQEASQSLIAEWTSFDFHTGLARWYLLSVLLFAGIMIFKPKRPDITELAICLIILAAGFTSKRHAPFAVMVMVAYGGQAIGQGALQPMLDSLRRFWSARRFKESAQISPVVEKVFLSFLCALFLAGGIGASFAPGLAGGGKSYITEVAGFIEQENLQGRMLNQYVLGGILIRRFYPERKVFIDGRADLYGDAFIEDYQAMVTGAPGWRERFESWSFDYVIMPAKVPLVSLLEMHPDYENAFVDANGNTVFRRRKQQGGASVPGQGN